MDAAGDQPIDEKLGRKPKHFGVRQGAHRAFFKMVGVAVGQYGEGNATKVFSHVRRSIGKIPRVAKGGIHHPGKAVRVKEIRGRTKQRSMTALCFGENLQSTVEAIVEVPLYILVNRSRKGEICADGFYREEIGLDRVVAMRVALRRQFNVIHPEVAVIERLQVRVKGIAPSVERKMRRSLVAGVDMGMEHAREKFLRRKRARRRGIALRIPRVMPHVKADADVFTVNHAHRVKHERKAVALALVGQTPLVFQSKPHGIPSPYRLVGQCAEHRHIVSDDRMHRHDQFALAQMH